MARVFVSHAADADTALTRRLVADLRAAGVDVWIAPDSIEPGESFPDAIDRGLKTSSFAPSRGEVTPVESESGGHALEDHVDEWKLTGRRPGGRRPTKGCRDP